MAGAEQTPRPNHDSTLAVKLLYKREAAAALTRSSSTSAAQ